MVYASFFDILMKTDKKQQRVNAEAKNRLRIHLESQKDKLSEERYQELDALVPQKHEDAPSPRKTLERGEVSLFTLVSQSIKNDEKKELQSAFRATKNLWPKNEHPLEQQVIDDWKTSKREYNTFLNDLNAEIVRKKKQFDLVEGGNHPNITHDIDMPRLLAAKKFLSEIYGRINFEVYDVARQQGKDKDLPISTLLRKLFTAETTNMTTEQAWFSLKKRAFFGAANLRKVGFTIGRFKNGKSLKGLRPKLDSSVLDALVDRYGEGRERGYDILLRIAEERRLVIPLEQPRIANLKNIMSARHKMVDIEKDRIDFMKILSTDSPEDDVRYIMNHPRIQELLWAVERNYRDVESGDNFENKDEGLEELKTFFGQLAYIGKYINENLNPKSSIEVPSKLLKKFGLSYVGLDEHYAETISDEEA